MLLKKYEKLLYATVVFVLFCIFTIFIKNYFKPFFLILILFFFCYPVYKILYYDVLHKKRLSAILTILIVNIILFLGLIVIGNNIVSSYDFLMTTSYNDIKKYFTLILNKFNQTVGIDILGNILKTGKFPSFT